MPLKLEWVCGAAKTPIVIWDGEVALAASLTLFNKGDLGVDTGTGKDFCLLLSCCDRNDVRLLRPFGRTYKILIF